MTEQQTRHNGLESFVAQAPASGAGIGIRVRSDLGHINLRGDLSDSRFTHAMESVLGQALPAEPNTFSVAAHRIYWQGPDEWLILADNDQVTSLAGDLRKSADGINVAVNDVSGGQIALTLAGANVREVFAKGCTLDLHPRVFTPGMCAQSGLARAGVLIALTSEEDTFDLVVRRSFADYLLRWLAHAANEFGVRIESA